MPVFETIFGAGCGVFIKVWANVLARQRYLRRPWEHVLMAGVGGFVGYNYYKWENQMLNLVNEQRALRNMPSIKRDDIMKTPIILGKKEE